MVDYHFKVEEGFTKENYIRFVIAGIISYISQSSCMSLCNNTRHLGRNRPWII